MSHFAEDNAPTPLRNPFVTYKRADGELIGGEYAWVSDPEYFEDLGGVDYVEVIKETWDQASSEVIKFGATSRWCEECEEDLELSEPVDGPVFCPAHTPPASAL